jgi:hypothetical protein
MKYKGGGTCVNRFKHVCMKEVRSGKKDPGT